MPKLTKREFEALKRPIYPQIQVSADSKHLQIQSMVELDSKDYYAFVLYTRVNDMKDLFVFLDRYSIEAEKIKSISDTSDKNYFKIEG